MIEKNGPLQGNGPVSRFLCGSARGKHFARRKTTRKLFLETVYTPLWGATNWKRNRVGFSGVACLHFSPPSDPLRPSLPPRNAAKLCIRVTRLVSRTISRYFSDVQTTWNQRLSKWNCSIRGGIFLGELSALEVSVTWEDPPLSRNFCSSRNWLSLKFPLLGNLGNR